VIRRGRVLSGALLLSALIVVALTAGAFANHSSLALLSQGTIGGNDPFVSYFPPGGTTPDGEHGFFETDEKLLPEDGDSSFDVYERTGGTTSRISKGALNGNGAFEAFFDAVSDDGAKAFFETDEKLESTDNDSSIDIYQRSGGSTTQITQGTVNGNGANDVFFNDISSDGSTVIFTTDEKLDSNDNDNCLAIGCDDVYMRSGGTTTWVSNGGSANEPASFAGASADGSRIFFETAESLGGGDSDGRIDVYEYAGGSPTLVSGTTGGAGNGAFDAFFEGASADGSKVFFSTAQSLDGATDSDSSIDVYQRSGGTTTQISRGAVNGNGAFNATYDGNSTDGARVFFHTREGLAAGNTDTDGQTDIYERSSGTTTEVSIGSTGGNSATYGATFEGASANGARVFFSTAEQLETSTDGDSQSDVYQRFAGATTQISTGSIGGNGATGAFFDGNSADGGRVFFSTTEKLEPTDNVDSQIDIYERQAGVTSLISVGPNGGNGAFGSFYDANSSDGTHVFFSTAEKLITPTDADNSTDVYDASAPEGYARPKAATPSTVRLVPAFTVCSSPNGSHGAPLALPSCTPTPASSNLTVGTPDSNGQGANSSGSVTFKVVGESPIDPSNGDQADVNINLSLTDVRNNVSPYSDYTGELRALIGVRITDRYNGPTETGPATVNDTDLGFNATCVSTPSPAVGGTCTATTSFDGIMAGLARENKRTIVALKQVKVFDGGPDGDADTANNSLFQVQGLFTP
jgi:hypothetical protein